MKNKLQANTKTAAKFCLFQLYGQLIPAQYGVGA